ncbi:MAG: hypothetical protein JWO15_3557 [Sphingomonadales bacterium]|nr:hypothetical protein [Sphingomonadales bacterium]
MILQLICCGAVVVMVACAATLGYLAMYFHVLGRIYGVTSPCPSYSDSFSR